MVDRQRVLYYQGWCSFTQFNCLIPREPKKTTFNSFSANIPAENCRDLHKDTAPYKQAVCEIDSDVKPLALGFSN